jgi:hypothetical protein
LARHASIHGYANGQNPHLKLQNTSSHPYSIRLETDRTLLPSPCTDLTSIVLRHTIYFKENFGKFLRKFRICGGNLVGLPKMNECNLFGTRGLVRFFWRKKMPLAWHLGRPMAINFFRYFSSFSNFMWNMPSKFAYSVCFGSIGATLCPYLLSIFSSVQEC